MSENLFFFSKIFLLVEVKNLVNPCLSKITKDREFWASDTHQVPRRSPRNLKNLHFTTVLSVRHAPNAEIVARQREKLHFTTIVSVRHAPNAERVAPQREKIAFYHSFERPTSAKWREGCQIQRCDPCAPERKRRFKKIEKEDIGWLLLQNFKKIFEEEDYFCKKTLCSYPSAVFSIESLKTAITSAVFDHSLSRHHFSSLWWQSLLRQSLIAVFQDSHHFGSLWWQSLMTAITSAVFDDSLCWQPSLQLSLITLRLARQPSLRQSLMTVFQDRHHCCSLWWQSLMTVLFSKETPSQSLSRKNKDLSCCEGPVSNHCHCW